jgi:hypothetical protein
MVQRRQLKHMAFLYNVSPNWNYVDDQAASLAGELVQGGIGYLELQNKVTGQTLHLDYVEGGVGLSVGLLKKAKTLAAQLIHDGALKTLLMQAGNKGGGVVLETLFSLGSSEPLSDFTDGLFSIAQFGAGALVTAGVTFYFFSNTGIPNLGFWTHVIISAGVSLDLPGIQMIGGFGRVLTARYI